jgi:transposase InsO family protein
MGSRGDCFDNAVAESFFATLNKELVNRRPWPGEAELRSEIFDDIEVFYNRQRRHGTLGMRRRRTSKKALSALAEQTSPLCGSRPLRQ